MTVRNVAQNEHDKKSTNAVHNVMSIIQYIDIILYCLYINVDTNIVHSKQPSLVGILFINRVERALSVYIDANRRRAAICTDKARSRGL